MDFKKLGDCNMLEMLDFCSKLANFRLNFKIVNYGTLFVIATPIGNLNDISNRALQTLKEVAIIACEDTRHSKNMLQHFGIQTPLTSLHSYNEEQASLKLITKLQEGLDIGLISDAGTPLISDPGFSLVQQALSYGIRVSPIAGPCAAIAALSVAGISASSFIFEGFLPSKALQRQQKLHLLKDEMRTLIFYEAPHRLLATITDLTTIFGGERLATLGREISKTFETILHSSLDDLLQQIQIDRNQRRGECVLIVAGNSNANKNEELSAQDLATLRILLSEMPLKKAANLAAQISGKRKNLFYAAGLNIDKD